MRQVFTLFAVLLCLAVSVAVVGCGGGGGGGTTGTTSMRANYPAAGSSTAMGFMQKHKTATSLAAGVAAYKAAKMTGQNREAAGGNKNFAQRHPMITGAAAAMLTHHMLSKHHM